MKLKIVVYFSLNNIVATVYILVTIKNSFIQEYTTKISIRLSHRDLRKSLTNDQKN